MTFAVLVNFFSLTFMFGNCVAIVVAMFYNMSSLGWNGTLAALLGSIFTYVVGWLVGELVGLWTKPFSIVQNAFYAVSQTSEILMHWFIAEIYISVSQTAKTILRKRTHEDDPERLAQDKQFEQKLLIARTLVIALAITNGVIYYFARTDPYSTFIFRANFFLGFLIMLMCLLVWGWTIYSLYSEISEAKDVLPNKGVFATHAMLLSVFMILYLADNICFAINDRKNKENLVEAGMILENVYIPTELLTCFLVACMVQPFSQSGLEQSKKFKKYLFNGHETKEQLEAAMIEKYPQANEIVIRECIQRHADFVENASNATQLLSVVSRQKKPGYQGYEYFGDDIAEYWAPSADNKTTRLYNSMGEEIRRTDVN